MTPAELPANLGELAAHQPLPHLLWRIGEWQALSRYPLAPPVLDLGCGDGWFGKMLYGEAAAYGLDRSPAAARKAHRMACYQATLTANATRLPFKDGVWRTVVANSTLEHVRDLDAALAEIGRVLAPEGRVLITAPNDRLDALLFHRRWLAPLGVDYPARLNRALQHAHCDDLPAWKERLARAGLSLVATQRLLPRAAVVVWDAFLPAQFVLRRLNQAIPWYRWTRGIREAVLRRWARRLEIQPGETGGVWLLAACKTAPPLYPPTGTQNV